jgi:hypothetical protein
MELAGDIHIFQQAGIGLAGAIDGSPEYIDPTAELPRENYRGPSDIDQDYRVDLSILDRYAFDWNDNQLCFRYDGGKRTNLQINSVDNYISYHLVSLMEKIRKRHHANPLKVIILGCTHYPFFMHVFQQELTRLYHYQEGSEYIYRPFMAEDIQLIDPSLYTAMELYTNLNASSLFNDGSFYNSEFYISIPNVTNKNIHTDKWGNFTYAYKYGRSAGDIQQYVKRVVFSRESVPEEIVNRLAFRTPMIFDIVRQFNLNNPKTAFLEEKKQW